MNTKSLSKSLINRGVGDEPFFNETPTQSQMLDAYSYYAKTYKLKDAKKFIVAYLDKLNDEEIKWSGESVHDDLITTLERSNYTDVSATSGWVAKLLLHGSDVHPTSEIYMWENILKLAEKTKAKGLDIPKEKKDRNSTDLQKVSDIIERIDNLDSDQILSYFKKINLPTRLLKNLMEYVNEKNIELQDIFSGKDKTSLELRDKARGKISFFGNLLVAITQYTTYKKSVRKIRKKKSE